MAIYNCIFITRIKLFTTMFTVNIGSLRCVNLDWLLCHAHLCPYHNIWPEAVFYVVLQVLQRLSVSCMLIYMYVPIVIHGLRMFIVILQ